MIQQLNFIVDLFADASIALVMIYILYLLLTGKIEITIKKD
jgi:ABC-type transport system involved in cytochrome bd biosynthesis fused ATPase/permease subunit